MIMRIHKLNQSRASDTLDSIQLNLSDHQTGAMRTAEVMIVWNAEVLNMRSNSFLNKCHGNCLKPVWLLKMLISYLKVRRK